MTDTHTGRIDIANPLHDVWRLITTFADIPTWYDNWDRCEHDPDQPSVHKGRHFRLVGHRSFRARVADCYVIDIEQPTLVRWIEHRRLQPPVLVEFRLAATSAEITAVTHTETVGKLRRGRKSQYRPVASRTSRERRGL